LPAFALVDVPEMNVDGIWLRIAAVLELDEERLAALK
jgi:hypothetical protein